MRIRGHLGGTARLMAVMLAGALLAGCGQTPAKDQRAEQQKQEQKPQDKAKQDQGKDGGERAAAAKDGSKGGRMTGGGTPVVPGAGFGQSAGSSGKAGGGGMVVGGDHGKSGDDGARDLIKWLCKQRHQDGGDQRDCIQQHLDLD